MLSIRWFLKGCIVSAACHGAIGPKTAHWLLSVLGLVHMWCEEQPETVAAFNAETGRAYMKTKPPIEAMVDDATGKAQDDAFAFARWVTENHLGMEYAPEAFREECERRDRREA